MILDEEIEDKLEKSQTCLIDTAYDRKEALVTINYRLQLVESGKAESFYDYVLIHEAQSCGVEAEIVQYIQRAILSAKTTTIPVMKVPMVLRVDTDLNVIPS